MKGYATLPNCVTCGRFCTCEPGASWRMVYSGGPIPMPDHEQIQCRSCTERYGPLQGQAGIAGVVTGDDARRLEEHMRRNYENRYGYREDESTK